MNAAVHAYPTGPEDEEAEFELRAEVEKDAISVTVVDEGTGIRPRPAFDSNSARLGLLLMAALASRLEIRSRSGGGTSLRIDLA
jgi:anti-sigma regulatory factor (Ser/Thr protein kinase)